MTDVLQLLRAADPAVGRELPSVTLDEIRARASAPLLLTSPRRDRSRRWLPAAAAVCLLATVGFLLARRADGPTGSTPREIYAVFMRPDATDTELQAVADVLDRAGIPYRYVGKEEALTEFRRLYTDASEVTAVATAADMPTSFRLQQTDLPAERYLATLTDIARLPGVASTSALDRAATSPPPTGPPVETTT